MIRVGRKVTDACLNRAQINTARLLRNNLRGHRSGSHWRAPRHFVGTRRFFAEPIWLKRALCDLAAAVERLPWRPEAPELLEPVKVNLHGTRSHTPMEPVGNGEAARPAAHLNDAMAQVRSHQRPR
jgi:hypothetical protein